VNIAVKYIWIGYRVLFVFPFLLYSYSAAMSIPFPRPQVGFVVYLGSVATGFVQLPVLLRFFTNVTAVTS
jgi:hypothetical protein